MIKVQGQLNRNLYVACSGGVDSIAIADFLSNNHTITLIHVNHNEGNSKQAQELVMDFASDRKFPILLHSFNDPKPSNKSWEEFWREQRLQAFNQMTLASVVTAHHLDDCVETWIWSSLHGKGKIIPYRNGNIIRPFMQNRKQDLVDWATKNNLPFIEDQSNSDMRFARNIIRKELMPSILKVNPGIHKVILKKVINNKEED